MPTFLHKKYTLGGWLLLSPPRYIIEPVLDELCSTGNIGDAPVFPVFFFEKSGGTSAHSRSFVIY